MIYLEPDRFDEATHPEVIPLCKKLQALSLDSTLTLEAGNLYFCLNSITLDSHEKCVQFLDLTRELGSLMPEDFSLMANFCDLSSDNVRLMIIDEAENGFQINVAQV